MFLSYMHIVCCLYKRFPVFILYNVNYGYMFNVSVYMGRYAVLIVCLLKLFR